MMETLENFLLNGKKQMSFLHIKKRDKQILENYHPIFFGSHYQKNISKNLNFLQKNDLISHNKSEFKPVDSFINQLLSITHEMYKSFDNGLDVCGVLLDISKVFDKVWHKGLIIQVNIMMQGHCKDQYLDHYYI